MSAESEHGRIERMARLLATAEYGCGAFDEFNEEERGIALEDAEAALKVLDGWED